VSFKVFIARYELIALSKNPLDGSLIQFKKKVFTTRKEHPSLNSPIYRVLKSTPLVYFIRLRCTVLYQKKFKGNATKAKQLPQYWWQFSEIGWINTKLVEKLQSIKGTAGT